MTPKKNSMKKKNPIAHELGQQKYRQRIVKNKKAYNRKKNEKIS